MSDSHIDIYLGIVEAESGRPIVKAIFDDEATAEAWVEGVEAAYMRGCAMLVHSDNGAIDIDEWLREAKGESDRG